MRAVTGNSSIVAAVNNHYTKEKIAILPPVLQLLEVQALDWISSVFRNWFGLIIMVYPLLLTDATLLINSITCNHVTRLTKIVIPASECSLLLFAVDLALALSELAYTAILTKV